MIFCELINFKHFDGLRKSHVENHVSKITPRSRSVLITKMSEAAWPTAWNTQWTQLIQQVLEQDLHGIISTVNLVNYVYCISYCRLYGTFRPKNGNRHGLNFDWGHQTYIKMDTLNFEGGHWTLKKSNKHTWT